eukprot:gene11205-14836_t
MVGNVLDALDASGQRGNTVLGEHNLWCKMTNFELGTRVPFILR